MDPGEDWSVDRRAVATTIAVVAAAFVAPVSVEGYTSALTPDAIRAIASAFVFLVSWRAVASLLAGRPTGALIDLTSRQVAMEVGLVVAAIALWLGVWVLPLAAMAWGQSLVALAASVTLDPLVIFVPLWVLEQGVRRLAA